MAERPANTSTRRGAALAEAQSLGIDTKGMSTREARESIKEVRSAQDDMAKFINKVLDSRPAEVTPQTTQAQVTTRTTEDPAGVAARFNGGGGSAGGGDASVPVAFYCWVDGKVGKVVVNCQSGPSPI